jgi:hypothetical protein
MNLKYLVSAAFCFLLAGILVISGIARINIPIGNGQALIYPAGFCGLLSLILVFQAFKLLREEE